MSSWSVLTVNSPVLKTQCACGHARKTHTPRTPRLRFSYLGSVPTDATSRHTRRRRGRRLNVKCCARGAARRVEPVGAHREFPRAQNAVRSRPRPQRAGFKDATSSFERLSSVPTDATSRPTRHRRGRRVKYSSRGAARRVELAGAHREIPRLKTQCTRGNVHKTHTSRTPPIYQLNIGSYSPTHFHR